MAKTRDKIVKASNQGRRVMRPWQLVLSILGLVVSIGAFVLLPDPTLRVLCLATTAWLVWQLLRAAGLL